MKMGSYSAIAFRGAQGRWKLIRNNVEENSVFSKIPENDDGEVEGEFYFVKSGSTGCSVFFKRNKAIISTRMTMTCNPISIR
jgi:hypothetical protein